MPPVEASSGQEWYYFRSAWHLVSLCVRLTFSQMYTPTLCHPVEASSSKGDTTLGQLDIWSAFGSGWPLIRCNPYAPFPLVEASSSQEWYHFRSARHAVSLTCAQMYLTTPHCPLPPWETSRGWEWYYCGSNWHLVSLWVKLTCGQMYPLPAIQSPTCPLPQ